MTFILVWLFLVVVEMSVTLFSYKNYDMTLVINSSKLKLTWFDQLTIFSEDENTKRYKNIFEKKSNIKIFVLFWCIWLLESLNRIKCDKKLWQIQCKRFQIGTWIVIQVNLYICFGKSLRVKFLETWKKTWNT